jgi:hypothetical protein
LASTEKILNDLVVKLALVLALGVAGCGGNNNGHGSCPQNGIAVLSWTVHGQAATTQTCASFDHLTLDLQSSCGNFTIEPIPCTNGAHWEYDYLPEGATQLTLDGVNANGRATAQGVASAVLTAQAPATPTAIDLN